MSESEDASDQTYIYTCFTLVVAAFLLSRVYKLQTGECCVCASALTGCGVGSVNISNTLFHVSQALNQEAQKAAAELDQQLGRKESAAPGDDPSEEFSSSWVSFKSAPGEHEPAALRENEKVTRKKLRSTYAEVVENVESRIQDPQNSQAETTIDHILTAHLQMFKVEKT